VLAFVTEQNRPRDGVDNVVRISDGRAGMSAATIKRRLAAVSSLYGYLVTRGDVGVSSNPVPRGLPTRKSRHRGERGLPLIRGVRRLPRILEPGDVEALMRSLRTARDRAMVQAMVLGGLRRCEVLALRLEDLRLGEWRVFIAEGKGGHQRLVPVSQSFFATVADYLNTERPADAATDRVFVALKGPRRGQALSADGVDTVLSAARARAGLVHGTCHELRHTCSPGFGRAAWRSRRCRLRPVIGRSRRPASTYISAMAGSLMNTSELRRRSKLRPRSERPDDRRRCNPDARAAFSVWGPDQGVPLGRHSPAGAGDGRHHGPLPGPAGHLFPTHHGVGDIGRAAVLRRPSHS
jgi:integrase